MPGSLGVGWGTAAADAAAVLSLLRAEATMSPQLRFGVAIASTAVANVPGMGDASANWVAIAARLDGGVKLPLNDAMAVARSDWIAEDRQAFDTAVTKFQGDTEATRKFFEQIEKCLDDIGDAYRAYWVELGVLGLGVLSALLAAFAMLFTPLAPEGAVVLQWLGTAALGVISFITKRLGEFLAVVGATLITGAKGMVQLYNVKPTGSAAIDFTKSRIEYSSPSVYLEPKRYKPQPYTP